MSRSALFLIGMAGVIAAAAASCAPGSNNGDASTGSGGAASGSTGSGKASTAATGMGGDENITVGAGTGGNGPTDCPSGPNDDNDHDGFTVMQGDCNDCDPNVNPDAIDTPDTVDPDGGMIPKADNNCDGKIDLDVTCDTGLALDDVDPNDAAKAIELCHSTMKGMGWGLISSKYVAADGKDRMPGLQTGLLSKFGPNVTPRAGKTMLGLSSGHMRTMNQPGFCVDAQNVPSQNCVSGNQGTVLPGFPQAVPGCPVDPKINDDIALEVNLRAPTNATGYEFNFKFNSFEFPKWICSSFNDQFIALVNPAPKGAINGNISFDSMNNPVSVNIAFFDVCDPATKNIFACNFCMQGCNVGSPPNPACSKQAPNPYCPSGTNELLGTGMNANGFYGGATSWLQTTAPIKGGSEFTIRFTIWDTGDNHLDSHVLIDAFKWIATGGTVAVMTKPPA